MSGPAHRSARAERGAEDPRVLATAVALPRHRYRQRELAELAAESFPGLQLRLRFLERFFDRVGVEERYLALPAEAYRSLTGLEQRNRAYIEVAMGLGEACLRQLFEEAGVEAGSVGQLTTTTVTGLAVPSLDARLMNRLPFGSGLKRVPLFGLGCLGGAAGLARTSEYLRAYPEDLAILLSVELCSLTLQPSDCSMANIISTGLFGDGAAAVLLAGARHPLARASRGVGPEVVATRSVFFPNTERAMGWDVIDTGFQVVLSADVPTIVGEHIPPALDAFLGEHGLSRGDIVTWVCHPGGPKVIEALEHGLGLPPDALDMTRQALAKVGNLSSASVLYLLDRFRRERAPAPGAYGILMAMGPAFAAELVLLRW